MASTSSAAANQEMLVKLSTEGVPKLICPICNKAHSSLSGYVKHLKKHEPPGGYACRYCDERYCMQDDLKKHLETKHITYACRLCKDTTFTTEDDYRAHIRDEHKGIDRQLYKCEKCGAAYKTIDPYNRHMNSDCGKIRNHKCDQCGLSFMTKYNLKQHIETHSSELKFCCSYCGRNFRMKARLVEHERTHTGEKPYKCDVCGKSFSHRESIVTHSSIHTGIRLVECRCCSSRFSCYSNLIKHRRNRPDTCGLPEYDPPRNRIRKFTSRIPAVLNPTSEIRVVNVNKVIKPDDLEKLNAVKKLTHPKVKTKPTARKSTGGRPRQTTSPAKRGPKPKKIPKQPAVIEFEDNEENDNNLYDNSDEEDEWPLAKKLKKDKEDSNCGDSKEEIDEENLESKFEIVEDKSRPKRQCKPKLANEYELALNPEENITKWSDDSEDEYVPDIEETSEDDMPIQMYSKTIKKEKEEDAPDVMTDLQIEPLNDFEFNNLENTDDMEIKSEDEYVDIEDDILFNEKDKILESLLNDNDYSHLDADAATATKPTKGRKRKHEAAFNSSDEKHEFLRESELVLVKTEDDEELYPQEDVLDIQEKNSLNTEKLECVVLLEDITHRYPDLRTQETVKVPHNVQPFYTRNTEVNKLMRRPGKRGTYRPRVQGRDSLKKKPPPLKGPKLSAKQLKEQLKKIKSRDKSYQCIECIKMYYMRKPYERHLREGHSKTDEEIREIFKDEDSQVALENVYRCPICDKIYLMYKRLQDHIPMHGPEGNLIYKCPCYCSVYFATREEATAHSHLMHREQLWCEICEKFMTGIDTLKSHRFRFHSENKKDLAKWRRNLVCDKCGKKFLGRTQLTDHVRSDCGRVPIYQCQVCGKCLTTAGILKTHMLLHKDDRPYQCEQCGKSFKIKAQYKTHTMFAHSDEKRFKCHLCPKAYPYRESLLTHMAVHTGIKRFMCNGCGKRFTCVSNLQAHRKVTSETCGLLPLNAKATQYMGVQKGTLLLGSKPEPGLDYVQSQTLVAKEVYTPETVMLQEFQTRMVEPSESLSGGMPLNYTTNDMALL